MSFLKVLPIVSRIAILTMCIAFQISVAQTASPDFSIVIIPDPQNLSATNPAIFATQTQWVANNITALNIRTVVGEGDMVDHNAIATEWANADSAIKTLDGVVPYAMAIGNHDYDNQNPSARGATRFNTYFGPLRYASYSWYGGNYKGSNENFYTFFSNGNDQYMVLALEFYPRDEVITWAESVLNTYSDKKVIVVTHSFEGSDGMRVDLCDTNDMSANTGNNPQLLWSKLLEKHSNLMLVLSGHLIGNGSAHRSDLGEQGNIVHQIFTNFQDWTTGKEGYLRILRFHPSLNTIEIVTYSPYLNAYQTSSTYQFTLPMNYTPGAQVSGGFEGKVRSNNCILVPGAQVSTAGYVATTNYSGVYKIPVLPAPSGYGLSVFAPYYAAASASDTVNAGFNTQVNFFLAPTVTASCSLSSATPSVTICSPAANSTIVSPVRINAGARSSRTLSYMQIYIDGVNRGTFYTSAVDQSYTLPSGTRRITVQAKDTSGAITKSSIYVTVSATNSSVTTVTISSPLNSAIVSSPIAVRATATAASGTTIKKTSIYLDGVSVYSVSSATISTGISASLGTHRLTVQALDSAGVYAKQTIYVTVK
jgi:hypothetical protein